MVAARRVAKQFDVPLVVEFQDPCPASGREPSELEARALERALEYASAVIATTATYANELRERYPQSADKVHVVYLSMPPAPLRWPLEQAQTCPQGNLTLLHPGTLYGGAGRNARSLVAALPLLFAARPAAKNRVRVRLVGAGVGLAEAAMEAKRLSVADSVSVEQPVPPEDIWKQMTLADCLVLIKFPGPEHDSQIPGKLFHFLATERPILALVPEGETAAILRQSGLGLIAPPDDPAAIADQLVKLWDAKTKGEGIVTPKQDYISRFSEENMGIQLAGLLDEIVKAQRS